MDEEIKKEFEKVWEKIKELELQKNLETTPETLQNKETKIKKNYGGLAGGIRLLIDEDFLNQPKTVNEIWIELKRQGYHRPQGSVSKLLSVNFMKNQRLLTRIKENKKWKYVIRK